MSEEKKVDNALTRLIELKVPSKEDFIDDKSLEVTLPCRIVLSIEAMNKPTIFELNIKKIKEDSQ